MQSKEQEFNEWFNELPLEAKNKLEGQLKPALDCARKIAIRRRLPRNKFATVISLALPPRAISELEALVPEFANCDSSYSEQPIVHEYFPHQHDSGYNEFANAGGKSVPVLPEDRPTESIEQFIAIHKVSGDIANRIRTRLSKLKYPDEAILVMFSDRAVHLYMFVH